MFIVRYAFALESRKLLGTLESLKSDAKFEINISFNEYAFIVYLALVDSFYIVIL
ncbi:16366_t:CDS:2 [Dentiscutata erythropus]|uniref:16366_t:CDS:1 n=1 Tax=Dentiscutata erythropus TaxID=1348616 RepID=A0A9N8YZ72_9GLOM|nr:16366_t:CDS:2 [Dentiscutata erythropus]